jgi:hypothetical protein
MVLGLSSSSLSEEVITPTCLRAEDIIIKKAKIAIFFEICKQD